MAANSERARVLQIKNSPRLRDALPRGLMRGRKGDAVMAIWKLRVARGAALPAEAAMGVKSLSRLHEGQRKRGEKTWNLNGSTAHLSELRSIEGRLHQLRRVVE